MCEVDAIERLRMHEGEETMGIRKKRKRSFVAGLIALSTMALCGCNKLEIGDVKVVLNNDMKQNIVFSLDTFQCTKSEAQIITASIQNRYEKIYPEQVWDWESGGKNLESYMKDIALQRLIKIKSFACLAEEQNVTLDESEQEKAKQAAEALFSSLTAEQKENWEVTQSILENLYSQYILAGKIYKQTIAQVPTEISDDEARQVQGLQIVTDSKEKAEEALRRVENGEAFQTVASEIMKQKNISFCYGRDDCEDELESCIFSLGQEEVSQVVESDNHYYLFYCEAPIVEETLEENKKAILEMRQQQAFSELYDPFVAKLATVFNDSNWEMVDVSYGEAKNVDFFQYYK